MTTSLPSSQGIHPLQRKIPWGFNRDVLEGHPQPRCADALPVIIWKATGRATIVPLLNIGTPVFEWVNNLPQEATLMLQVQGILDCLSEAKVLISNISAVRDYLLQHKDIIYLALSICRGTKEVFGPEPDAQLVLELERDPEFGDKHLTLEVRLKSYDGGDIWEKIEKVSVEYEKQMAGKSGWILITTDYRHPQ